jgi:hypothetical protein
VSRLWGPGCLGLAIASFHAGSAGIIAWLSIHDLFGESGFGSRLTAALLLSFAVLSAAASGAIVLVVKSGSEIAGSFALAVSIISLVTYASIFL